MQQPFSQQVGPSAAVSQQVASRPQDELVHTGSAPHSPVAGSHPPPPTQVRIALKGAPTQEVVGVMNMHPIVSLVQSQPDAASQVHVVTALLWPSQVELSRAVQSVELTAAELHPETGSQVAPYWV